ncbi:hypothetical protein [Pseudomonas sp. Irchel 3F5]|uniref:hypothetical protein n=1 Tax=Pseudomonas sp. Irchel 3F5 TaxID=2009002 RepID=UPI000BA41752|nr:hypothetical protein [Pseudomonas sp. Irchel 3F5]
MTKYEQASKKNNDAEPIRAPSFKVYKRTRTKAMLPRSQRNDVAAPTAELLPDVGDDQVNLVPARALVDGLEVTVPEIYSSVDDVGDMEVVTYIVNGTPLTSRSFVIGDDFKVPSHSFTLNPNFLSEGPVSISYTSLGQNLIKSRPLVVLVDKTDPGGNNPTGKLQAPAEVGFVLTAEYLEEHGGVTLTIPAPVQPRINDTYRVFWGHRNNTVASGTMGVPGESQDVMIREVDIRALGESLKYITYDIADRAGNINSHSEALRLYVSLNPLPADLRPPVVQPTVNRQEARRGVSVQVNAFSNWLTTDLVVAKWQGRVIGSEVVGSERVWPMEFVAPFRIIALGGDEYAANVTYEVVRGSGFGSEPASSQVNITVAGPVNPEEPNPVNPNLLLPVLTSFTGATNHLTAADAGHPAMVNVPMYAPAVEGQRIALYYENDGVPVAMYTVLGTEPEGQPIPLQVSAEDITAVGNGLELRLWYRLLLAEDDLDNYQQSQDQSVISEVAQLENLLPPILPVLVGGATVNCSHFPWRDGLTVRVLDGKLEKFDDIELEFYMINRGFSERVVEATFTATIDDPLQGASLLVNPSIMAPAAVRADIYLQWTVSRGDIRIGQSALTIFGWVMVEGTGSCFVPTVGGRVKPVAKLT